MKTLRDLEVAGAILAGDTGPEVQVGDSVKLFLDQEANPAFPEFILGVVQHPITKVACDSKTSYVIEYDEALLLGAAENLRPGDVIDYVAFPAVDILAAALTDEIAARIADVNAEEAARIAADVALIQTGTFTNNTGNTTVTLPAGCERYTIYGTFTGVAGTRIVVLDVANAVAGAEIEIIAELPVTTDIVIDFRNATAGGTQLDVITTDNSGDNARAVFGFTTIWNKKETQYPN